MAICSWSARSNLERICIGFYKTGKKFPPTCLQSWKCRKRTQWCLILIIEIHVFETKSPDFIFQNHSIRIKSFWFFVFESKRVLFFHNVMHLCNYWYWLSIEQVWAKEEVKYLSWTYLVWSYIQSCKLLLFRVFRFRIESVMVDILTNIIFNW